MNLSRCFTCLVLATIGLCANRGFAQSPTLEALKEYPSAAKAFEKRMARARSELKRYRNGNREAHLIVGRVQLEGDDDPETVVSQMIVNEQGFFVDVIRDPGRPVGFRCHRYKPVDFIVPKDALPAEDDVIDVGIVQLSRASASKRGTTTGTLRLEGGGDPSGTTATIRIMNARANTPSGGTEGIGRKYLRIKGKVEADGTVRFESLSEGDYYLTFARDGYVSQNKRISVSRLNEANIGAIELELPRRIDVDYVIAPDTAPEFDAAKRKTVAFVGGHKWKARPDTYGWDLVFKQAERKIHFDLSYAPCYLTDLGPGTLEDHIDVPLEVDRVSPRDVPVVSGHVYLLNQRFWKHHVLFRVDVGDPIPAGAEMPNGIPVSPGAPSLKDVIAHYQFDGNAEELNGTGGAFELKNVKIEDNAVNLNGIYGNGNSKGYLAVARTPRQNYEAFTFSVRFKAESFGRRNQNIVAAGPSFRWFRLSRSKTGNLAVNFNNSTLSHIFEQTPVVTGKWHTVICGVNIPERIVSLTLDKMSPHEFQLPDDFEFAVVGTAAEERDKAWTFTNYSNGDCFHGLIDEFTVLNGYLSSGEFQEILAPLKKQDQH